MSLTLRDARELRDQVLANDEWDAAGHAYAAAHDRYYGDVHTVENWFTSCFMDPSAEATALRAQVLPRLAMDPTVLPDTFFAGPELVPATEEPRRRLYGEE